MCLNGFFGKGGDFAHPRYRTANIKMMLNPKMNWIQHHAGRHGIMGFGELRIYQGVVGVWHVMFIWNSLFPP